VTGGAGGTGRAGLGSTAAAVTGTRALL